MLRIIRLSHRKLHLDITCPNSQEKFNKITNYIKLKSVRTQVITHLTPRKPYLVIIFSKTHEKFTKTEFKSSHYLHPISVYVLLLDPNLFPCLDLFICRLIKLDLFRLYLSPLSIIYPCLVIFTLN